MKNQKITKNEVKMFLLQETCSKCNNGNIIRNQEGTVLLSAPPQLSVKCTNENCDFTGHRFENEIYPKFEYEEIIPDELISLESIDFKAPTYNLTPKLKIKKPT